MSKGSVREVAVASRAVDPIIAGWNDAPDVSTPVESEPRSPVDAAHLLTSAQLLNAPDAPIAGVVAKFASVPPRFWVPVLILMAILLCVSAGYDVLTVYTDGSWSNSRWRFAIIGSAIPKMLKVTVAAVLVTFAMTLFERRVLTNILAGFLAVGAVIVLLVAPFFLMDSLQVRQVLPARMSGDIFVANVSFAVALVVLMSLVLFACASTLRKTAKWLQLDLNSPEKVVTREWDR